MLFTLEEGDRFYFLTDRSRIPYQIEEIEVTEPREYKDWKIVPGYTTVIYRDDNKKKFEKTNDFEVVFLRNAFK